MTAGGTVRKPVDLSADGCNYSVHSRTTTTLAAGGAQNNLGGPSLRDRMDPAVLGLAHEEPCAFPVMLCLAKWRSEVVADFLLKEWH